MSLLASFPYSVELTDDNQIVKNNDRISGNKVFNLCLNNEVKSIRIKYISEDKTVLGDIVPDWIEKVFAL